MLWTFKVLPKNWKKYFNKFAFKLHSLCVLTRKHDAIWRSQDERYELGQVKVDV